MGGAKRLMEMQWELESAAMSALKRSGAVTECEIHEGNYDDNMDLDAEEAAKEDFDELTKSGLITCTKEEWEEAIKSALQNTTMDGCGYCAKNAASG